MHHRLQLLARHRPGIIQSLGQGHRAHQRRKALLVAGEAAIRRGLRQSSATLDQYRRRRFGRLPEKPGIRPLKLLRRPSGGEGLRGDFRGLVPGSGRLEGRDDSRPAALTGHIQGRLPRGGPGVDVRAPLNQPLDHGRIVSLVVRRINQRRETGVLARALEALSADIHIRPMVQEQAQDVLALAEGGGMHGIAVDRLQVHIRAPGEQRLDKFEMPELRSRHQGRDLPTRFPGCRLRVRVRTMVQQ